MRSAARIAVLLPAVAASAVFAGACTVVAPGEALPSTVESPVSTTRGNPQSLDVIDPCALLTADEVHQFGANQGIPKTLGGARTCKWSTPDGNGVFGTGLRNSQGLKDIVVGNGTLSDLRIGNRAGKALKEDGGAGTCMIVIGITESSRVDVQGLYKADTARACDLAMRVATLIEPRLPKGE
jgi:hypothetical protein